MVTAGRIEDPNNKDVAYVSSDDEDADEWLSMLLHTKFWLPCKNHWEEHRGEMSLFCLYCYKVVCPKCTHDEPGHRLLKVHRYAYRSIILVKDMHDHDLGMNVSRIQTFIVNKQKGVHLRPVRRSPQFRPSQGAPRCRNCFVWLRTKPNMFCSLACQANADTSLGDFSETEADHNRRQQIRATLEPSPERIVPVVLGLPASPPIDASPEAEHGYQQVVVDVQKTPSPTPQQPEATLAPAPVADSPSPQQPEAPPAPVAEQHQLANHPVTLRRRPRKMAHPVRAPFI